MDEVGPKAGAPLVHIGAVHHQYIRVADAREVARLVQEATHALAGCARVGATQLQRDLTAARSEEIRALTEYNRNLSQLSLAEASTFKRLGMTVDGK